MIKSLSLFLTVGMLCSSFSPAYSRVDAKLEAEITREYEAFTGKRIEGLKQQPCKAVQFVYELQEKLQQTHDQHIADKIAAIISEGAGVGGIDNERQATEDERKILLSSLQVGYEYLLDSAFSSLESSEEKELSSQQIIVKSALEMFMIDFVIFNDTLLKSYNFIEDEESFRRFEELLNFGIKMDKVFIEKKENFFEGLILARYLFSKKGAELKNIDIEKLHNFLCRKLDDNKYERDNIAEEVFYYARKNIKIFTHLIDWALYNLPENIETDFMLEELHKKSFDKLI